MVELQVLRNSPLQQIPPLRVALGFHMSLENSKFISEGASIEAFSSQRKKI